MNRISGITLIELMVTVAVLAIVVTIGIPSFQSLIRNNQVIGDNNTILSMIALARSEAIRGNQSIVLSMTQDTSWEAVIIPAQFTDEDPIECDANSIRCATSRGTSISDSIQIMFDNRGFVVPFSTTTFDLQHVSCNRPQQARSILITGTGYVLSEQGSCDA